MTNAPPESPREGRFTLAGSSRASIGTLTPPVSLQGRTRLVVMPRGVESLGSLLAGSVSAQESSFQVRAATHTMAMVVATSMTEKYR